MDNTITEEKLKKYFDITAEAIAMVKKKGFDELREDEAKDFLDMAERYCSDAQHFHEKGEYVLAFGALNYAHGWLDAGARIALFKVSDSRLFTVDEDRFEEEEEPNPEDENAAQLEDDDEITPSEEEFINSEDDAELL